VVRIKLIKEVVFLLSICTLIAQVLSSPIVRSKDDIDVTISILGNKEIEKSGRKVFVTGVWNWINVTLNENVSTLNITIYKGETPPPKRSRDNFYGWSYDDGWKAIENYDGFGYIDTVNSIRIGNKFCFRVTTDNFLRNDSENWTLSVEYNGNEYRIPILMEKPTGGLGVSGGITVRVEPFQTVTAYGEHYFTTINNGNLPLTINVSYDKLNDRITTSNINRILLPDEKLQHKIEIRTQAWRPGIMRIGGTITGIVPDEIIPVFNVSHPTIQLNTAFSFPLQDLITIIVGHSDYELEEIEEGNVTFQHKKEVEMYQNEEKNITSMLCGRGNVTLSIQVENLSVLGVWLNGKDVENYSNIEIELDPLREDKIEVKVKPLQGVKYAEITYFLSRGNETHTYKTSIIIKEKIEEKKEEKKENILPKLLVGIGLIISLLYILMVYLRGRRT